MCGINAYKRNKDYMYHSTCNIFEIKSVSVCTKRIV